MRFGFRGAFAPGSEARNSLLSCGFRDDGSISEAGPRPRSGFGCEDNGAVGGSADLERKMFATRVFPFFWALSETGVARRLQISY